MSSCLGRAAVPVKRVWRGLSSRVGHRRRHRTSTGKLSTYVPVMSPDHDDADMADVLAGLGRLRKEVRTCEYQDVHIMWEMLNGVTGDSGRIIGSKDDMADDDVGADGKGGAPGKTRRARRKGRKPAPWNRLVAYCCAF